MTDNVKTAVEAAMAEIGENSSPMAALAAAYNHAPHPGLRDFLNDRVNEILMIEFPKLVSCLSSGPAVGVEELQPIAEIFTETLEAMEQDEPGSTSTLDATARDIGRELAELVDRAVRRTVLADTHVSRMAVHDVVTGHAKLLQAITSLSLTEEQKAIVAKRASEDADADS